MLKKLVVLFAFLSFSFGVNAASPGVTLTGTILDISGNPTAGTVTAILGNYGANAPIVIGNNTLAPIQVSTTANGSGVWSLTLWGSDQISPVNTTYTISITPANSNVTTWIAQYLIKTGSYDLSNLVPLTVSPTGYIQNVPGPQGPAGQDGPTGPAGPAGGSVGTANDNIFTAPQRFGTSIPGLDFTSFMPAGGCSILSDLPTFLATGSITNGSHNLTIAGAQDWKNGCGITIEHAGATSTVAVPTCGTVSTAIRSGTTVTITCSASTNLSAASGNDQGVILSGCSNTAYNGTFQITSTDANSGPTGPHFTYTALTSATDSTTGCAVSFLLGWQVGIAGSTDYYYWGSPIDSGSGMGTAVGPIHITNGNATLSAHNYNWMNVPVITGARMIAWYKGSTSTEANATCIGVGFDTGFMDWGTVGPCPAMIPTHPPTSPTAQALTTTISSGAGSTTLVLTDAASNMASSQSIFHDEMPFLDSCVTAVNTNQTPTHGPSAGSTGCFIPSGIYNFNSDFSTDRIAPTQGGIQIHVAGTPYMQTWPWIIGKGIYSIIGDGYSGGVTNFSNLPTTIIGRQATLPAAFVVSGVSGIDIEGFSASNLAGNGIVLTENPSNPFGAVAGALIQRMIISMSSSGVSGVPIFIGPNVLKVNLNQVNLTPSPVNFPATVLFTTDTYQGIGDCCIFFQDLDVEWHHFYTSAPGGQQGQGINFTVQGMESEEHGQFTTGGFITQELGCLGCAAGTGATTARIANIVARDFQNADASDKTFLMAVGQLGSGAGTSAIFDNMDQFNPIFKCDAASVCGSPSMSVTSDNAQIPTGMQKSYVGFTNSGGTYNNWHPSKFGAGLGDYGASPSLPALSTILPAPSTLVVNSTGSGSLAAATYCMKVTGLDGQATAGETMPSPEICQAVGSSSSIVLNFNILVFAGYSDFRLYYDNTGIPNGEDHYLALGLASNNSTFNYTFTSTSGAVSQAAPLEPTAYLNFMALGDNVPSCFACLSPLHGSGTPFFYSTRDPLGIGLWPTVGQTYKLLVGGGSTRDQNDFMGATSTDGFELWNGGTASSGNQQWSPRTHYHGSGWKTTSTAASQNVDCYTELQPVQGSTSPTLLLADSCAINAGSYSVVRTIDQSGNESIVGGLTIAGGTQVKKVLSGTGTLDFANQAAIGCNDLTITVSGAALGDTVSIGVPNGSVPNGTASFSGWVSSSNTVSVRYCNLVSGDPASGTFRATVTQF